VDRKVSALEVEQAARTAKIVQQMTIDVKEVSILADASNDMLVPDFFQHSPAAPFQKHILHHQPFGTAWYSRPRSALVLVASKHIIVLLG
jgi:hypothetical protein